MVNAPSVGVEVHGLSISYDARPVLSDVSLTLAAGAVTALVGPNGAGKSTLLRAISGLQTAEGAVTINGRNVDPAAHLGEVAYMPQDTSAASSLTVLEVVLLGRLRTLGLRLPPDLITEAEAMLDRFGVAALAGRTLDAISGGQWQLVYLAQALFRRPKVLLLDEPTVALDLRHQLVVLQVVREAARQDGIVVAIAMHDLSLAARFAHSFVVLSRGGVKATGAGADVLTKDRLARVYGIEAEVISGEDGVPWIAVLRAIGSDIDRS